MISSDKQTAVGYYSVVRFVADPSRDEAVNVGLVLVAEGGTWAKFRWKVPKTRLSAMGRRGDVDIIERWADTVASLYEVDGDPGYSRSGRLDLQTLRDWASEFAGSVRVTPPRVAIEGNFESLFGDLYRRYVGRVSGPAVAETAAALSRAPVTGAAEKRTLITAMVKTMSRWHAFDRTRIVRDRPFRGRRLTHVADIAIVNQTVSAIVQAVPFVHGSESEVIHTRALLVDAAVDLPKRVVKIALHDDPPADRVEWLAATRGLFEEVGRGLQLVPRYRFDQLGPRFEGRFFPELDGSPSH